MLQRRALLAAGGAFALGAGPARAALSDVIAAVRPSVLPFGTYSPLDSPRFGFRGTAFVVGDGRRAITNAHVLGEDRSKPFALRVPQPDGGAEWRTAEVAESDVEHDLALLRVQGAPLTPLRLGPVQAVREGHAIALMGYPIAGVLGFQPVTHRGIVSSVAAVALPAANASQLGARALSRLRQGTFEVYQLDATAYPGNSGGPVLDAETGEVLAVLNMVLVKGSREAALAHPSGISYAIPVRWVRELLDDAPAPGQTR